MSKNEIRSWDLIDKGAYFFYWKESQPLVYFTFQLLFSDVNGDQLLILSRVNLGQLLTYVSC